MSALCAAVSAGVAMMYGWYSDNSVFLENPGVYLRPGVYSVVVLEESPCPRGSSRTNFQVLILGHQVLVLVLESQLLDNNTGVYRLDAFNVAQPTKAFPVNYH